MRTEEQSLVRREGDAVAAGRKRPANPSPDLNNSNQSILAPALQEWVRALPCLSSGERYFTVESLDQGICMDEFKSVARLLASPASPSLFPFPVSASRYRNEVDKNEDRDKPFDKNKDRDRPSDMFRRPSPAFRSRFREVSASVEMHYPGWCSLCNVDCKRSEVLYRHHVRGKRHQALLALLNEKIKEERKDGKIKEMGKKEINQENKEADKTKGRRKEETAKARYEAQRSSAQLLPSEEAQRHAAWCSLCDIRCSNMELLHTQHVPGKKHQIHLLERNWLEPDYQSQKQTTVQKRKREAIRDAENLSSKKRHYSDDRTSKHTSSEGEPDSSSQKQNTVQKRKREAARDADNSSSKKQHYSDEKASDRTSKHANSEGLKHVPSTVKNDKRPNSVLEINAQSAVRNDEIPISLLENNAQSVLKHDEIAVSENKPEEEKGEEEKEEMENETVEEGKEEDEEEKAEEEEEPEEEAEEEEEPEEEPEEEEEEPEEPEEEEEEPEEELEEEEKEPEEEEEEEEEKPEEEE